MNFGFSRSAEVCGQLSGRMHAHFYSIRAELISNGSCRSRALEPIQLSSYQMAHVRRPRTRDYPAQVQTARQWRSLNDLWMNPAPSSTTLWYHTLVQELEDLDPEAQHVSHGNAGGECSVWIAEQAAFCRQCRLILALPEDPGGHVLGGPTFSLVLPRVSDVGATSRSRVKCYRSGPALLSSSPWTLRSIL